MYTPFYIRFNYQYGPYKCDPVFGSSRRKSAHDDNSKWDYLGKGFRFIPGGYNLKIGRVY